MITVLLTLLCVANVLLLGAIAFAIKGQNKETKMVYAFMAITLILDMVFAIGGVVLW